MRFVFLRCGADAARAAMQARGADGVGAVVLMPLEALAWAALVGPHRFVVSLV
jgi:hypothetical protein